MKTTIKYPSNGIDKKKLEEKTAEFHAILILKKIDDLNIDDSLKSKILEQIIKELEQKYI